MASLPVGPADKLGNLYEHWGTAYRVASILSETASRFRVEPPGGAGAGIELVVTGPGVTWAEQVMSGVGMKRELGTDH